jgi:hypothetical protein
MFPAWVALATALLLFGATSLYWSMTRDPAAAEPVAFAIAAAALALAHRAPGRSLPAVLSVVAAALAAPAAHAMLSSTPAESASAVDRGAVSALYSATDGLFTLTPIVYVALAGALLHAFHDRLNGLLALAAFAALLVAASAWPMRAAGPAGHGLTAALALLAPGLAFVIDRARLRPWLAVVPIVAAGVVWNYWLMVQYTVGMLPKDEPVSFAGMVRQQMAVQTRSPYVYPFALPASAFFAWREGMPIERFEQLAFEPRQPTVDLAMDPQMDRFLLDGWEPGAEGTSGPHWIRDARAHLALPLDFPPGRDIDVTITARTRLEEPAVKATIALEANGHEIGRFVVPPEAPADFAMRVPAGAVGRIWRAGYNRLTFVSYGVERVDPSDTRPPGPLGSRLKDRPWPVAIYRVRIAPAAS